MYSQRLLVLGAGRFYIETIQRLRKYGFTVLCLDKDCNAPGFQFSNDYAVIDISDKESVLNYAKCQKVDAILPINDFGTRSAFYACQKLGLKGNLYISGVCGNDKGLMRDVWRHEDLPQPDYFIFSCDTSIQAVANVLDFPMVVKPTDCGGGGRGISVAKNLLELEDSIAIARPYVRNNRLIAERFIEGTEVTVDGLVHKGETHILAISDKIKPISKYRVATSLNFPSFFSADIIQLITEIVAKASEALGVLNGAIHAELIISSDQQSIKLIEMGLRGGGGHVFSTIVEEVSGVCAPVELAKILCGIEPNLQKTKNQGCVYRFFNPPGRGVLQSVDIDSNVLNKDFVISFAITIKPGDEFNGLSNSLKRIGYVIVKGETREDAICNADLIENSIRFRWV